MLLLWLGAAIAAPGHNHDVDAERHDVLWQSYLEHFEPEGQLVDHEGWSCATGVVQDLKDHWSDFTVEERARITRHVAPFKRDLLEPMVEHPPPPGNTTCWGQQGSNVYKTDNFSIEWDSNFSQSQAEQFGNALERSYDMFVHDLGWEEPAGLPGYQMMVYVSPENYGGAYTTVEQCGAFLMPYIVAYRGSFQAGAWAMDMAAHEFHHAIQFAYGFGHQFWYWEATATYAQEFIYPTHDEWGPYIEGFTAQPQISMHASDQQDREIFNHMYGMAVWNFYLDEHVGGPELVQDVWDWSVTNGYQYDVWQDDALEGLGYDFEEVFQGFLANNTVMDFADHDAFPRIHTADEIDDLPSDGEVGGYDAPESRGQAYLHIDTDIASGDFPDLVVTFEGDDDADFMALLVGTADGQVLEVQRFALEDGVGKARLPDLADFDDAWLVAAPLTRDDGAYEFAWSALAAESLGRDGLLAACGCQSAPSGRVALASLLSLGLLVSRRRRR